MGVATQPPIVGPLITKRLRSFSRPNPVAAALLASDALKCSRRIGFRLFGTPPDVRYTREEIARFEDGDYVDSIAAEVFAKHHDARIQVPFNWLPDVALKGKADVGYRDVLSRRVVGEVKSQNERGWARAVGLWNDVPAAPKVEWVVQVGLAACSPTLQADMVHIVLVDNDRFEVAEWLFGLDTHLDLPDWPIEIDPTSGELVEVTVRSLVAGELARQAAVLEVCEEGALPSRIVPGFGLVEEPPARDSRDEPWACRYCAWQPTCAGLDAGEVPEFGELPS